MTDHTHRRALLTWATGTDGPMPYGAAAGALPSVGLEPLTAVAAPDDTGADIHLACSPRADESHLEFARRGLADLADAFDRVHREHRPHVVHAVGWLSALAWQRVLDGDDAVRRVRTRPRPRSAFAPLVDRLPPTVAAADHRGPALRQADEYVPGSAATAHQRDRAAPGAADGADRRRGSLERAVRGGSGPPRGRPWRLPCAASTSR
jgi:hypothetical protein